MANDGVVPQARVFREVRRCQGRRPMTSDGNRAWRAFSAENGRLRVGGLLRAVLIEPASTLSLLCRYFRLADIVFRL
jgi:hypothetical protein